MDNQSSSSSNSMAKQPFRFKPAEVKEMQERLKPLANGKPDRVLMRELAIKFSDSRDRAGSIAVQPQQVLNWYNNNRYKRGTKIARGAGCAAGAVEHQQVRGGPAAMGADGVWDPLPASCAWLCRQQREMQRTPSRGGEEDGTSDSTERSASFAETPSDGHDDVMDKNSGHCKYRDQDTTRSEAKKQEESTRLTIDQHKSVDTSHHQEVVCLQGTRGLLKMLPEKNKVISSTGDGYILLNDSKMDGETGGGKIPLSGTKVQNRRVQLPLPEWLKDIKSKVADIDGWQHVQVLRANDSRRKDKFYTHRDYRHTFRSTSEVKYFLETGIVIGKGHLQKKSCDPNGQSSGAGHSEKIKMVLPTSGPIKKPQGDGPKFK